MYRKVPPTPPTHSTPGSADHVVGTGARWETCSLLQPSVPPFLHFYSLSILELAYKICPGVYFLVGIPGMSDLNPISVQLGMMFVLRIAR